MFYVNVECMNRQKKKGSQNINKMLDIMSTHYDELKKGLGLDDALAPSSEDEKDDYICKYSFSY